MNISTSPRPPDGRSQERRGVGALVLGGAHGSLAIARSLGRRGIHALWRLARGEVADADASAREAAWMHASRDAVAAARLMLAGSLSPRDYLQSLTAPMAFAAFAADDPLPGVAELPLALARAVTRRLPVAARNLVATVRRRIR